MSDTFNFLHLNAFKYQRALESKEAPGCLTSATAEWIKGTQTLARELTFKKTQKLQNEKEKLTLNQNGIFQCHKMALLGGFKPQ